VTVVAPDPVYADALTKVVIIDPETAATVLPRFDAAALMIDYMGTVFCTPNWHASIQAA